MKGEAGVGMNDEEGGCNGRRGCDENIFFFPVWSYHIYLTMIKPVYSKWHFLTLATNKQTTGFCDTS